MHIQVLAFLTVNLLSVFGRNVHLVPQEDDTYDLGRHTTLGRRNVDFRSHNQQFEPLPNHNHENIDQGFKNGPPNDWKSFKQGSFENQLKRNEFNNFENIQRIRNNIYLNVHLNDTLDHDRQEGLNEEHNITPEETSFSTDFVKESESDIFSENMRPNDTQILKDDKNEQDMVKALNSMNQSQDDYHIENSRNLTDYNSKIDEEETSNLGRIEKPNINPPNEETMTKNMQTNGSKLFISRTVAESNHLNNTEEKVERTTEWVWGTSGGDMERTTLDPLDNRAGLTGDNCATGMIRVGGRCVQTH